MKDMAIKTMTSQELQRVQSGIEFLINQEVQAPMKDWTLLKKYLDVLKDIDTKRRELWNEEKFGPYEEWANNVSEICSDDIPF